MLKMVNLTTILYPTYSLMTFSVLFPLVTIQFLITFNRLLLLPGQEVHCNRAQKSISVYVEKNKKPNNKKQKLRYMFDDFYDWTKTNTKVTRQTSSRSKKHKVTGQTTSVIQLKNITEHLLSFINHMANNILFYVY